MSTPSHYDAIDLDKIKNKVPFPKYWKPIKEDFKTNRIAKIEKDSSPSCCTYEENDAFYKVSIDSPIKWPANKAKRITYVEEQAKRKNFIPSPAAYRPEDAVRNTSIGLRGKMGYYKDVKH